FAGKSHANPVPKAPEWDLDHGSVIWLYIDLAKARDGGKFAVTLTDAPGIAAIVRSTPETPISHEIERPTLKQLRRDAEEWLRNVELRRLGAPMSTPKPRLECWMELN